jgi:hypothetical protein
MYCIYRTTSIQDTANWGYKLKLDVAKPILGLSCHPTDSNMVLLLHADGALRCYQAPSTGVPLEGATLACLYTHQREFH